MPRSAYASAVDQYASAVWNAGTDCNSHRSQHHTTAPTRFHRLMLMRLCAEMPHAEVRRAGARAARPSVDCFTASSAYARPLILCLPARENADRLLPLRAAPCCLPRERAAFYTCAIICRAP